jgi:hypothetical protein
MQHFNKNSLRQNILIHNFNTMCRRRYNLCGIKFLTSRDNYTIKYFAGALSSTSEAWKYDLVLTQYIQYVMSVFTYKFYFHSVTQSLKLMELIIMSGASLLGISFLQN